MFLPDPKPWWEGLHQPPGKNSLASLAEPWGTSPPGQQVPVEVLKRTEDAQKLPVVLPPPARAGRSALLPHLGTTCPAPPRIITWGSRNILSACSGPGRRTNRHWLAAPRLPPACLQPTQNRGGPRQGRSRGTFRARAMRKDRALGAKGRQSAQWGGVEADPLGVRQERVGEGWSAHWAARGAGWRAAGLAGAHPAGMPRERVGVLRVRGADRYVPPGTWKIPGQWWPPVPGSGNLGMDAPCGRGGIAAAMGKDCYSFFFFFLQKKQGVPREQLREPPSWGTLMNTP